MGRNPHFPKEPGNTIQKGSTVSDRSRLLNDNPLAERAGMYLLCIPEHMAWLCEAVYQGHSMSRRENDWLLVVRAKTRQGYKVAFFEGDSPGKCVRFFGIAAYYEEVQWRDDKFR